MTDEEMAGGLTDEQMAAPARLAGKDAGPSARRAARRMSPGPRDYTDEELGIDDGPIRKATPSEVRADVSGRVSRGFERMSGAIGSAVDRYSGGGYTAALRADQALADNPIARAVDRIPVVGALIGKRGGQTSARALKSVEDYRAEHPIVSQYTDMPGYLSGAPGAVATGIERALPAVANPLARAGRAVVASGLTGGTVAGAESVARGDEPIDVLREAGRGYIGGTAVGAPISAAGLLLRGGANTVLGSKGAKAREYLTERRQPLTAPDTSDAAIGAAAQRTDEAVKDAMAAHKQKVASGPYMEAINDITPEQAGELVDVAPLYRNLKAAANDPANLQSADKLNTLAHMLEQRRMTLPDGSETLLMTQEQVNGLRRALGSISGVGQSTAAKLSPLRDAFAQAKALVDQGPYAEANRRHTAGMADLNQSLDMVGLDTSTNPDEPIKGNLRVTAQRAGQNTVTAGADTERLNLEAFKAKHPELANAIDAPEILRRQGDLAFNLTGPSHGGFIERHGLHLSPFITAAMATAGHGLEGAASVPLALAIQNRNAIAGRLLYTPAQRAQLTAQLLLGAAPVISAPGRDVIQEGR